jgi:hypothetical protein
MKRHFLVALAICMFSIPLFAGEDLWDSGCEMVGLSAGGSIFRGSCSPVAGIIRGRRRSHAAVSVPL